MSRFMAAFAAASIILLLTSCSSTFQAGPKNEVSAFSQKTLTVELPGVISVDGDYGNIEVFTAKGNEVKCEINTVVRGVQDKDTLEKRLKDFKLSSSSKGKDLILKFRYQGPGRNAVDTRVELKLYVPKRLSALSIALAAGKIKLQDDFSSDLTLSLGCANTEINHIRGRIIMKADMGDIRVNGGRLSKGTDIATRMGNIRLKSELEKGEYALKTGLGNIELDLPETTLLDLKASSNIKLNDFENSRGDIALKAESSMGEIVVRKYSVVD